LIASSKLIDNNDGAILDSDSKYRNLGCVLFSTINIQ